MNYRLLACILTALCGGLLHAQSFEVTASPVVEDYRFSVSGEADICLSIIGVGSGEQYELYLQQAQSMRRFDLASHPSEAERIHGDYLLGVGAGGAFEVCISNIYNLPGELVFSLRKGGQGPFQKSGPIETAANTNIDSMLNTIFRDESCFELEPVRIVSQDRILNNGQRAAQTGTFSNGSDLIGMEEGIMLTTGFHFLAAGPNSSIPASGAFPGATVTIDQDAQDLVGGSNAYFDVAILEFKFIPTTDTIEFEYVFFSEEYCFGINSSFGNDAFGFFLEGPNVGTTGRENIATLPSGEVVSARTLNHVQTPDLFIDNSPPSSFSPCIGDPIPQSRLDGINYDGFSVKLKAKAAVTPCEEHTLKMIVVDAGDPSFDSGIFLEAGSFTAGLIANPEPSVAGVVGQLSSVEGCDTASLSFSRLFSDSADLAQPLEVEYNLITAGLSLNLADEGVDFELPPSPFVIPAGQSTATLKIPVLLDSDNTEGPEAFVLRYEGTCNCQDNRDTFWIEDTAPLQVEILPAPVLCPGETTSLTTAVSGGDETYEYVWPDGSNAPSVSYTSTGRDTTIELIVTDGCGTRSTASVFIATPDVRAELIGTDFSLCGVASVNVPLILTGDGPFTVQTSEVVGGIETINTLVISADTTFTIGEEMDFSLLSVADGNGCPGTTSGLAMVRESGIVVRQLLFEPTCAGQSGSILLNGEGGNDLYSFEWTDGFTGSTRNGLIPGTYTVEITRISEPGCSRIMDFTFEPITTVVIDEIRSSSVACPGVAGMLTPIISGGAPPYTFNWVGQGSTDSTLNFTSQAGEQKFILEISDGCGTVVRDSVEISFPVFGAEVTGSFSTCNRLPPYQVPITVNGPAGDYSLIFTVSSASGTETRREIIPAGTSDLTIFGPGTITLQSITNRQGCEGELFSNTAELRNPQLVIDEQIIQPACFGETGSITLLDPAQVPVTIRWSDGGPGTSVRNNLPPGIYGVTVVDQADASCSVSGSFELLAPVELSIVESPIIQEETCTAPGSITLEATGGTSPLTYAWSNGTTGPDLVAPAGPYQVSITDANSCLLTRTFTIPDGRSMPDATITVAETELNCQLTSIPVAAPAAAPEITYRWLNEAGLEIGNQTELLITEAGEYRLIARDARNGCENESRISITQSADIFEVVVPSSVTLTCANARFDLTATVTISDEVTFEWRRDGQLLSSGPTLTGVTTPGLYVVTATRTSNGCVAVRTSLVGQEMGAPQVTGPQSPVGLSCREAQTELRLTSIGPNVFDWQTSNGSILGATDEAGIFVDRAGIYQVRTTNTETGCDTLITINVVTDGATVAVDLGPDETLICTELGNLLDADLSPIFAGTETRWLTLDGEVLSSGPSLAVNESGTFVLEAIHPESGCSSFDTILVVDESPEAVDFELTEAPCAAIGASLVVTSVSGTNGPFSFSSSTGRTTADGTGLTGLPTGDNTLIVMDSRGCELIQSFTVTEGNFLSGFTEDITVTEGETVRLGAEINRSLGEISTYEWQNLPDTAACTQCASPRVLARRSFTAGVEVTDVFGCSLLLTQRVFVEEKQKIFMPTAFSPADGNGVNDTYTVFGDAELIASVRNFAIYDRWGSLVFQNSDFQINAAAAGWNGRDKANLLYPSGAYAFLVEVVNTDGTIELIRGSFTLVQ